MKKKRVSRNYHVVSVSVLSTVGFYESLSNSLKLLSEIFPKTHIIDYIYAQNALKFDTFDALVLSCGNFPIFNFPNLSAESFEISVTTITTITAARTANNNNNNNLHD